MKKLSLLFIALILVSKMSAMVEITGEFQPWDDKCTISGNTLSFLGEWNGVTFKFYDEELCIFEGGNDLSAFDVIVLQMSDVSCMFKVKVEYTDGAVQQDEWTTETVARPGVLVVAVPLNADHKNMVKDFFIQSAKYPGSLTIDKIYACTNAEYQQLLNAGKPKSFNLTLEKIDEGGGSAYDAITHTITIQDEGSHKGWYFDEDFRDFSAFDQFVVEFEKDKASAGEIGIEYADNTNSSVSFEAGATRVVVPLTSGKSKLRQVYVKGLAGASFVISKAFFATKDYPTGLVAIKSMASDRDNLVLDGNNRKFYTLDGKQVLKPGKGIYIEKNGKFTRKRIIK